MPPNPAPIMMQIDLRGALSFGFFGVLLTIFVMALIDTMGSLIGVSARAGFLDADGTLPQMTPDARQRGRHDVRGPGRHDDCRRVHRVPPPASTSVDARG